MGQRACFRTCARSKYMFVDSPTLYTERAIDVRNQQRFRDSVWDTLFFRGLGVIVSEDHRQDFPQTAASPHQPAPEAIFEHGDAAPSRR